MPPAIFPRAGSRRTCSIRTAAERRVRDSPLSPTMTLRSAGLPRFFPQLLREPIRGGVKAAGRDTYVSVDIARSRTGACRESMVVVTPGQSA